MRLAYHDKKINKKISIYTKIFIFKVTNDVFGCFKLDNDGYFFMTDGREFQSFTSHFWRKHV